MPGGAKGIWWTQEVAGVAVPKSHVHAELTGMADFPEHIARKYQIHEWRHASAVLRADFPAEWEDLVVVLGAFELRRSDIIVGGGNKSPVARSLDAAFAGRGWRERQFATRIVVDAEHIDSPTHKVDCFKNGVALEIEWNNKDPFFDRDLNNFRLLFELRAVSVGVIITRCDELQDIFKEIGRGGSFGEATTHMSKLLPRLEGGGGGGCPVLVFGISKNLYCPDL